MGDSSTTKGKGDEEKILGMIENSGRINLSSLAGQLGMQMKDLDAAIMRLESAGKINVKRQVDGTIIESRKKPQEQAPSDKPAEENIIKPQETEEENAIEIESSQIFFHDIPFNIRVLDTGDYVLHYHIQTPQIDFVTRALLDETKQSLVGDMQIETKDVYDPDKFKELRERFLKNSKNRLGNVLKKATEEDINLLSNVLVNEMLGLGDIEYILADNNIEEVVVNSSRDVVWVYHKGHGWLKTNVLLPTEDLIRNYSLRIAREVGRELTQMKPLLDAHLVTGDRVNATLYPISSVGNTITIRRFSRTPWTAVRLIDPAIGTLNSEVAAFLWMAIEYELSIIMTGGTASGKTSALNALMPFIQANHRVISMEDTRELMLPNYQHWVPMVTRPPGPQGEGEISMLDIMENALRMRPDRIVIGEVRRKRETEIMFEAMHTGHSVYATFHAEVAQEVVDRITSPPMSIPPIVMSSLHLIVTQYRNRRTGKRRTFEVAELLKTTEGMPKINLLYQWDAKTDTIKQVNKSIRVKEELERFTGMNEKEMYEELANKQAVLEWLFEQGIHSVSDVGKIINEYYSDKETVLELARSSKKGKKPENKETVVIKKKSK
ncbi:MAG: hypothetical protein MSIBF_06440 [Candidatus Altiarchaeales archaeon IMC4]|nr:MAG: hypothetical protein MSIBF_06440 [Candidatus Altiarchaeales archaeon IMC4]